MTRSLTREVINRCLTKTPEDCPREYDASVIGKILMCRDPRHGEKEGRLPDAIDEGATGR